MSRVIRLLDEMDPINSVGQLSKAMLCFETRGQHVAEIAQWLEDHSNLPLLAVTLRSGGEILKTLDGRKLYRS